MITKEDKLIDHNLNKINQNSTDWISKYDLTEVNNERLKGIHASENLAQKMEQEKLIKIVNDRCDLTAHGRQVISNGGWVKHHESQKKNKQKDDYKKTKEIELISWQIKLTKFQVKSKWLPYILSLISFIISIFAYFN